MYLVEIGVLVFLGFQVFLLASHYANSYRSLERMNLDLEAMVEARTSELVNANGVKDRLLGVLSHDIRSPINSLRGMLQLYHAGAMNQDEFRQFSGQLDADLSNTGIMVDNILSWTLGQIKGIKVHNEPLDLTELVEHNFLLFATLAEAKQISLKHNLPDRVEVNADRNIMNLVLRNLLSNAIKFSFNQGLIEVSVEREPGMVMVIVRDFGTGMDNEMIKGIFSPAVTPSKSGTSKEKGTGLGLALCREYLSKAGGNLMVRSTPGQGTTFTAIWPG